MIQSKTFMNMLKCSVLVFQLNSKIKLGSSELLCFHLQQAAGDIIRSWGHSGVSLVSLQADPLGTASVQPLASDPRIMSEESDCTKGIKLVLLFIGESHWIQGREKSLNLKVLSTLGLECPCSPAVLCPQCFKFLLKFCPINSHRRI